MVMWVITSTDHQGLGHFLTCSVLCQLTSLVPCVSQIYWVPGRVLRDFADKLHFSWFWYE